MLFTLQHILIAFLSDDASARVHKSSSTHSCHGDNRCADVHACACKGALRALFLTRRGATQEPWTLQGSLGWIKENYVHNDDEKANPVTCYDAGKVCMVEAAAGSMSNLHATLGNDISIQQV